MSVRCAHTTHGTRCPCFLASRRWSVQPSSSCRRDWTRCNACGANSGRQAWLREPHPPPNKGFTAAGISAVCDGRGRGASHGRLRKHEPACTVLHLPARCLATSQVRAVRTSQPPRWTSLYVLCRLTCHRSFRCCAAGYRYPTPLVAAHIFSTGIVPTTKLQHSLECMSLPRQSK